MLPWNECSVMEERVRFVARLMEGEEMAALRKWRRGWDSTDRSKPS
jgi:hypothetical protein